MNDFRNNYFAQMQQAASEQRNETRQLAWQERIVLSLLRYAGAPVNKRGLKTQAKQTTGDDTLSFDWFASEFPAFPVRLLAQKLPYTHKTTLVDIYGHKRFLSLPWFKEYESQVDLYQLNLEQERAALVFNLPTAKEAFQMVLHNQPVRALTFHDAEERREDHWPRTTFPLKNGTVIVLESFKSFMQTVGVDWIDA